MIPRLIPKQHQWLNAKPCQAIMHALSPKKHPVTARYVGGCIRDSILGKPVKDIDIATCFHPEQIMQFAQEYHFKTIPVGIQHGTVLIRIDQTSFEVTSLRKDIKTDGRHAKISFTEDWFLDSQRRDFTVNAIYADKDGFLYDPQNGIADLLNGKIQFIGDASMRIREDYLRILRFFRFMTEYGHKNRLDLQALNACQHLKSGLNTISIERIVDELGKLFNLKDPRFAFELMHQTGVLQTILPETNSIHPFIALIKHDIKRQIISDEITRLYALVFHSCQTLFAFANRIKLSRKQRAYLLDLNLVFKTLSEKPDLKTLTLWIYREKKQALLSALSLKNALSQTIEEKQFYHACYTQALTIKQPVFPITARDLIKKGEKEGKILGESLQWLETFWIEHCFKPGKQELLAFYESRNSSSEKVIRKIE